VVVEVEFLRMAWVSRSPKADLGRRASRFLRVRLFRLVRGIRSCRCLMAARAHRLTSLLVIILGHCLRDRLNRSLRALLDTKPPMDILSPSSTSAPAAHAVLFALLSLLRATLHNKILGPPGCRSVWTGVDLEVELLEVVVRVGFESV
jgi:hypothetical protein